MAKRDVKVEALSYEQAIERLEHLIERIESGEIGLEESLKEYETGMALIRRCRSVLAAAETKIAELTADASGGLREPGGVDEADEAEGASAEVDGEDDEDGELI
jgi:exodeoxyribonuclease VII small subunit